jgi:hypothetical protein
MAPAKKTTTRGAAAKSKTAKATTTKAKTAKSKVAKAGTAKAKTAPVKPKTTSRKPRATAGAKAIAAGEERRRSIETAAYLKAEADGFSGDPVQYWLAAEAEFAVKPARRK